MFGDGNHPAEDQQETEDLNDIINQPDPADIYPTVSKYILSQILRRKFGKFTHMRK